MILDLISAVGSSGLFIIASNWVNSRRIAKLKRQENEIKSNREQAVKDSMLLTNLQKATDIYEQEIEFLRDIRQDLIEEVHTIKAEAATESERYKSTIEVLKSQLADAMGLIGDQAKKISDLENLLNAAKGSGSASLIE